MNVDFSIMVAEAALVFTVIRCIPETDHSRTGRALCTVVHHDAADGPRRYSEIDDKNQ